MVSITIVMTDQSGEKINSKLSYLRDDITNEQCVALGQKFCQCTTNTYVETIKVRTTNADTGGGGSDPSKATVTVNYSNISGGLKPAQGTDYITASQMLAAMENENNFIRLQTTPQTMSFAETAYIRQVDGDPDYLLNLAPESGGEYKIWVVPRDTEDAGYNDDAEFLVIFPANEEYNAASFTLKFKGD